jgi:hypothetical protein
MSSFNSRSATFSKKFKILALLIAIAGFSINAYALSPNFNEVSFYSPSGDSIDFYPTRAVFQTNGAPSSHVASYSYQNIGRWNGSIDRNEATIKIQVSLSNSTTLLTGKMVYNKNSGEILWLEINGKKWTKR